MIDSVFRTGKNYYFYALEECPYVVIEKKIPKYIIDNTEISSDSDRENSDEEIFLCVYKNGKQILSKTQRKASKRSTWKIKKSFWRKIQKAPICSWAL